MGLGLWRERRQRQETKLGPGLPRPHQWSPDASQAHSSPESRGCIKEFMKLFFLHPQGLSPSNGHFKWGPSSHGKAFQTNSHGEEESTIREMMI